MRIEIMNIKEIVLKTYNKFWDDYLLPVVDAHSCCQFLFDTCYIGSIILGAIQFSESQETMTEDLKAC